jgi:hypothetical protein
MLLLNSSKSITVDGVTVYPDHADPNQYWYLAAPVSLVRRKADDRAQFTFIKYKPAAVQAGVKGGGFLMFEVCLKLDRATEQRILSRLRGLAPGKVQLSPVPFDEGTVQCVALNLQGSGGTSAEPPPPGAFNAVEKILGASTSSLLGDNLAAFSLTLDQEGTTILEKAFSEGTTPVGVIYNLKFTGLRPALDVKITADFKRIYDHFSASLSGRYYFVEVGIEAGLERLKQDGAIKIEVRNFSTEGDRKEKEKWALEFFMDKLLKDWFEPTLTPGALAGGQGNTPPPAQGNTPPPAQGNTPPPAQGNTPPPAQGNTPPPAQGNTPPPAQGNTPPPAQGIDLPPNTAPATLQPAVLAQVTSEPSPAPAGYTVTLVPGSTGTQETLLVSGGTAAPVVRVGGVVRPVGANRQVAVDVPAGASLPVEVEYPAVPGTTETFQLFFDKDEPPESNWTTPPRTLFNRYVNNAPTPPPDSRFTASGAPNSSSGLRGAAALRHWVQNRVIAVNGARQVSLEAHASYEGDSSSTKRTRNQRLSERRHEVARAIIGSLAQIVDNGAQGQTVAEAANRRNEAIDRVARVTGQVSADAPRVILRTTLSRAQSQTPPPGGQTPPPGGQTPPPGGQTPPPGGQTPPPGGQTPPPGGQTPPPGGQTPPPGGQTPPPNPNQGTAGSPAIALKLKFVHQEELKTLTLEYSSSEAVQRLYAPQGFFGLMLKDLEDKDSYFVEVDLDDKFFRVFDVTLDAPVDFSRIGLTAAHLALDYGSPADPDNNRHGEFVFDANHQDERRFEVFMNKTFDTTYAYKVQYHFAPDSGWEGQRFSYELPSRRTEDRTLLLNPYEHLGFLDVSVVPNRIDWGAIESIDVNLRYEDSAGWVARKALTLTERSEPEQWRLRLTRPDERSYSYSLVYHLKDGTKRTADPVRTEASAVAVDDPFTDALEIIFFPAFDAGRVRTLFVDVEYEDRINPYRRDERVQVNPNDGSEVHMRISLLDPAQRSFRYRFTFVDVDGRIRRGKWIDTEETLLSILEG